MKVIIKNCNSIDNATISISPNELNIKYGINGAGKSSIAKAIELSVNKEDLSALIPFKYLDTEEAVKHPPTISGIESIKSIEVFNEKYVNELVFQQEEILENSFEIFIKNKDYEEKMSAIDKLVEEIRETFSKDDRIDKVLTDLEVLSDAFGKPNKSGGIPASAKINKAVGSGNLVQNVPKELALYKPYLESSDNVKWVKWQSDGNKFIEISDNCPYCVSEIPEKKEVIQSVGEKYNSTNIQHLNKLITAVENLGEYFSDEAITLINEILANKDGISPSQDSFMAVVRTQITDLRERFDNLKRINFYSFKGNDDIEKKVKSMEIDIKYFSYMDSTETRKIVSNINNEIKKLLENIVELKKGIGQQKTLIAKTIQKNKKEINEFLSNAGYSYTVDIEEENDEYKLKLKHKDSDKTISNSSNHLSYGEKNAFAMILFMYICLSTKPDLIILDDPISSYDKNKKFAIIQRLFHEKESYKNKTVVMFTHDFEPIVDMKKTSKHAPSPNVHFLSNKEGELTEISIEKEDITTFGQLCENNIKNSTEDIIKCIYLRRYYETLGTKEDEYHVLSSLVHHREEPSYDAKGEDKIPSVDVEKAIASITDEIPSFDYNAVLSVIIDEEKMHYLYSEGKNNYEKLQLFRMRKPYGKHGVKEVDKFINETYHIENEYIMQLDPSKYEVVPNYLILKCDECLETELKAKEKTVAAAAAA